MATPLTDTLGLATVSPGKTEGTTIVPERRIADVVSLKSVIDRIVRDDETAAKHRVCVQESVDGKAPFNQGYLEATGQEGKCNLNFGDAKKRVKLVSAGYYDLTESVPCIALIETEFGEAEQVPERTEWSAILSEEFDKRLKQWKQFDAYFQLLVQKFVTHGLGFLYFRDTQDWHWEVAGLEDFKLPRTVGLSEEDCDVAIVLKEVPVAKLMGWLRNAKDGDQRWNKQEVQNAIMHAAGDASGLSGPEAWEKWQERAKNNDAYISITSKENVNIVYAWAREFSGKVSQFITLRNGTNTDFLYKCYDAFENVNQCFNFFPYEVGTNGTLHSTRGEAHDIYAKIQVLNNLKCQTVDNAKFSGSLIMQPATETAAEDMAVLFFGGAAYIPPGVEIKNVPLANPSTNILPVLQSMEMGIGDMNTRDPRATQQEKTKFEVHRDIVQESVLPTAAMAMFYQPWGRHLTEVCRRMFKYDKDYKKDCIARGVPEQVFESPYCIRPYRAIGYGSPTQRMAALDSLMKYWGSLDPVGQNNLLRDQFAQQVTYGQVDRYVTKASAGGRLPLDVEIAELQNIAMESGRQCTVAGNDNQIIHLNVHFPSIDQDLTLLESGQGTPGIQQSVQIKAAHIQQHMSLLKPDELNKAMVAQLGKLFNNTIERVQAAQQAAEEAQQKAQQEAGQQPSPKQQQMMEDAKVQRQIKIDDAALDRTLRQAAAEQEQAITDAQNAAKLNAEVARQRALAGAQVVSTALNANQQAATPPLTPPAPIT